MCFNGNQLWDVDFIVLNTEGGGWRGDFVFVYGDSFWSMVQLKSSATWPGRKATVDGEM